MTKSKRAYSATARRNYLASREPVYQAEKYSLRDRAWDVKEHFDLDKPPSPSLINRDLKTIQKQKEADEIAEHRKLLDPANFAKWRNEMFDLPNGKGGYHTPQHQLGLFWVIVCLTLKWDLPDWVIEYFDLPADINSMIVERETLLTFVLLVAPRHGKTELVLHTLIWLIIYNPDVRIIYAQGIARTATRMMEYIQFELEFNEKLVSKYGPFKGDVYRWNKEEFTVATRRTTSKTPTFLPIGIGSNVRSTDADIIVVDDPQDMRRVTSESVAEGDYHHFTTELMTRREAHTPVFGIGSHLPVPWGDMWSMLEESAEELDSDESRIIIRKIRAHADEKCEGVHDGKEACTLWPEVRSYGFLMAQKAALDSSFPGMFEVVYQQMPKAASVSYFDIDVVTGFYIKPENKDEKGIFLDPIIPDGGKPGILDLERSWKEYPKCCGQIVSGMGFDPAAGTSADASESALAVRAACVRCGRRFVVDYWHGRQSPERHPDTIISFMRSYRENGLTRVRIEVNAYQKSLAQDQLLRREARTMGFHIESWYTDDRKWSPELGIPNLARLQNEGYVSVPWRTKADRAYGKAYVDAYKRYPRKPTDIPMADWLAELEVSAAIKDATVYVPENGPGYDDMPPYLQDDAAELNLGEVPWNTNELLVVET